MARNLSFKHIFALIASLATLAAFAGCEENTLVDRPVAQVGDKILTASKLYAAIPPNISPEDSAVVANEFVRRWVTQQVIMQKAEYNLAAEDIDIEAQIEDYRRALIVELYQQKLIDQKFHPNITEEQLSQYYEQMSENFRLGENIMKGMFAIVPKFAPDIDNFRKTLRKYSDDDIVSIEQYLYDHSLKYELSFDKWMTVSAVKKYFPAGSLNNEKHLLQSHRLYETQDSENYYFLFATETCFVDDTAPLEFVHDKIYTILLNKAKIEFLKKMDKELYNEALKSHSIKYFTPN